jgi:hypothetical protein
VEAHPELGFSCRLPIEVFSDRLGVEACVVDHESHPNAAALGNLRA